MTGPARRLLRVFLAAYPETERTNIRCFALPATYVDFLDHHHLYYSVILLRGLVWVKCWVSLSSSF